MVEVDQRLIHVEDQGPVFLRGLGRQERRGRLLFGGGLSLTLKLRLDLELRFSLGFRFDLSLGLYFSFGCDLQLS